MIIEKKIDDRKWKQEKRTTMKKSGKFSYTDRPGTPGVRHYRAVVPKSGKHAKGKSDAVEVTVFRWQSLNKVGVRDRQSTYLYDSVAINGVDYGTSFVGRTSPTRATSTGTWIADCTQVRARYGNSDAERRPRDGDGDPGRGR